MTIDIDERKVERNEPALVIGWTLATALGLIVGYLPSAIFVDQLDLGLARVVVPLLAGILIGVAQWLVLRSYVVNSGDWVLTLAGSWVVGFTLGLFIVDLLAANHILGMVLSYVIFGIIIAAFQWPVLRREIPHLWLWILANVIGWGLGAYLAQLAIAGFFGRNPANLAVTTVVNMAVTGLVAGLITGLALVWIVRQPDRALAA